MRRFALGCLKYTPQQFENTMVADFFDALTGYNEAENERIKSIAELIRISTAILRNTQPMEGGPLKPHDLWPFRWDKEEETEQQFESMSDEERKQQEHEMEKVLDKITTNGNSNIKS
jgi:hypothetical protein